MIQKEIFLIVKIQNIKRFTNNPLDLNNLNEKLIINELI